jgi:hypothetical protein
MKTSLLVVVLISTLALSALGEEKENKEEKRVQNA